MYKSLLVETSSFIVHHLACIGHVMQVTQLCWKIPLAPSRCRCLSKKKTAYENLITVRATEYRKVIYRQKW